MTWFRNNKFVSSLLAGTLIVCVGLIFFGKSKATLYGEFKESFEGTKLAFTKLVGAKTFPTALNVKLQREALTEYHKKVGDLKDDLLHYRPAEINNVEPNQFSDRLTASETSLRAIYREAGIEVPEEWHLGFERYTSKAVNREATGLLLYQLQAMEWLFTKLAESKPSALLNFHRQPLPPEEGKPLDPEPVVTRRGRRATPKPKPILHRFRCELTFRGRETALRNFLNELSNSQDYFFEVSVLRIVNEKLDPPVREDVKKGNQVSPDDTMKNLTAMLEATEEDGAEKPNVPKALMSSDEKIMNQILGNEQLNAFLAIDLVLFSDKIELPEIK